MRRLKIAHVVPCYWPAIEFGGPVRSVGNLARAQAQLGHDVTVFTTNIRAKEGERVMTPGYHTVDDVRVSYAAGIRPKGYFMAPGLAAELWRTLSRGVDIVHLHCLWVFSTLAGARMCELRDTPYVVAPRGTLNRWAIDHKAWKKRVYLTLLESRTLSRAAAVHFTTEAERDEFEGDLPNVVVPNAIPMEGLLELSPLEPPPDTLRLIIVGRIHEVKGFDLLLPALARAKDAGCATSLTVVGGDEGGYEATVRRLSKEHGLDDDIHFAGRLERDALAGELEKATIVIVPSHQESFGMAAAEGMAAARPIIASERVNIAPQIAAAGAGIVSPHSVEGLAASIQELAGRRAELRGMGERGRQFVRDTYAPDAVGNAMVEKYRQIMERRGTWR